MSANNKRCSSGNPPMTRTQSLGSLKQISRSKTCTGTALTTVKPKPERLEPIVTNKNSQLNDESILKDINCIHPAMVNELCLHAKGLSTIPNLSEFSKLQILDLSCNNITRIENLRNLMNLRELKLYGNHIERIENLECLTLLQVLQLQYNQIQTIGFSLMYLTHLQTLRLDSNKISLIKTDEVAKLTQLKSLDISDCPIENLDFINALSSITELRACNCNLKSFPTQLRNLRNLIDLNLSNNQLTNIISLKILPSLRFLHLSNNNIQDIQSLSCLIHLNELDLSFNRISLIPNTFEKLIDLQCLNISNNKINSWNNIDVLSRLDSLFILKIAKNPFLSTTENYIEKLSQLCSSLEIIDDISLKSDASKALPSESNEQLMDIDKELKEIDQTLERSIAAVENQFVMILNDLQKLDVTDKQLSTDNSKESNNANKKSKYPLFQALSFSEENY